MKFKHKLIIALGLIGFAIVGRLVPHLWNMTPLAAVGILAGARLGLGWGIGVPLVAMAVSDPILGLAGLPIMLVIYFSFALSGVIGYLMRDSKKTPTIFGGSLLSTIIFFLTTNAAVWFLTSMYSKTFSGLLASYIAGLPFLQNQIIGDLFFTASLFTVWEFGKVFAVRMKTNKLRITEEKAF